MSDKDEKLTKVGINCLSLIYLTPNRNPYKIKEN